jgi:hypothetical protein
MADTPEVPEAPEPPSKPSESRTGDGAVPLVIALLIVLITPLLIFSLWAWVAQGWVYSSGASRRYIQKLKERVALQNLGG